MLSIAVVLFVYMVTSRFVLTGARAECSNASLGGGVARHETSRETLKEVVSESTETECCYREV